MTRTIVSVCLLFWICLPGFAEEPAALPDPEAAETSQSAEVAQALATEKDSYGIPTGIYSIDFELEAMQRSIKSQQSSLVLSGGLSLVIIAVGLALVSSAPTTGPQVIQGMEQTLYGVTAVGLGAVVGLYSVIAIPPGIKRNEEALTSAFRSKYPQPGEASP